MKVLHYTGPRWPFSDMGVWTVVALLRENEKTHVRCVSWQRVRIQSTINVLNEVRLWVLLILQMMRIILQALFVPCRHHRAHIHSVEKVVNDHTFQSSFFDPWCCCITTSHMIGYYTSLPSLSMQARQKGFFFKWAIKICISFDTRTGKAILNEPYLLTDTHPLNSRICVLPQHHFFVCKTILSLSNRNRSIHNANYCA